MSHVRYHFTSYVKGYERRPDTIHHNKKNNYHKTNIFYSLFNASQWENASKWRTAYLMKCFQNIKDKHMYIAIWVINNSQKNPTPTFLWHKFTVLQICSCISWVKNMDDSNQLHQVKIYQHYYCCLFYFCEEFHILDRFCTCYILLYITSKCHFIAMFVIAGNTNNISA